MVAEFEHEQDTSGHLRVSSALWRLVAAGLLVAIGLIGITETAFAQATSSPTPYATATSPAATATPSPPAATPTATVPGPTATPVPALTLNTQQGPPGTVVEGSGSNFAPGDTVQVLFNGTQVDSEVANTTGSVSLKFTVPTLANGQYPVVANGQTRGSASLTFTISGTSLTLAPEQGPPGTSVTVTGQGFQPGETVQVSFNGPQVGTPVADTAGSFNTTFTIPNLGNGDYTVEADGQTSGNKATVNFKVSGGTATLSVQSGPVGTSVMATGTGFTPGDSVQLTFNGASITSSTADTTGSVTFTFTIPTIAPGTYVVQMTGTKGGQATASFVVTAPAAAATPTPVPANPIGTPQPAPAVPHDDRYFSQTGFRIDNDAVYAFFQSYGDIGTFGFPTSRTFTFLGCPVQFFQRQIIQVCAGAGAALINILDPGIFPYTKVNGSTFPPPNEQMKAQTPPVSDPNYDANISAFINANVPNQFSGQPVNFLDYFNTQGGLTIWGAPISAPAPDPNNNGFIYQRFQRGIMHYIQGTGTVSILIADYLKAMILDQNVPLDLRAEAVAQNSPYLASYCPGAPLWMCKPNQVPGTDYTFAFVQG